uniref:Coiled-coil domain containing 171 n=1 Tax=Dicentrarchus labrax TaxID=13489 RepID=A0A8C4H5Y0_DICLA
QEVSQKERSLRILGKHLSGVHRQRKQLEERLQRVEDELRDGKRVCLSFCLSHPLSGSLSHSLPVCLQALLSAVSQLYQTCSSRIDWLEQEVSAHRSHVTALRSELQDVCLRDNLLYVPVRRFIINLIFNQFIDYLIVAEFPETFPFADVETSRPVPLSDLSKEPAVSLSHAPSTTNPASFQPNPAPSSPFSKPCKAKTKEKKVVRRNRGGRRQTDTS